MLRSLSVVALLLFSTVLQAADAAAKPDATAKIEAALDSIAEVQYLDTQLGDVVTDLGLRHRIEILVDWDHVKTAEGAGAGAKEISITCSLRNVPLASVLSTMLTPRGLTWAISNDVLLITSLEQEPKYVQTKVYNVGDFAPDLEGLQDVIELTINSNSWQSNGGNVGAIARHDDTKSLVVTHTARTQRRVAGLINDLRATKAKEKK